MKHTSCYFLGSTGLQSLVTSSGEVKKVNVNCHKVRGRPSFCLGWTAAVASGYATKDRIKASRIRMWTQDRGVSPDWYVVLELCSGEWGGQQQQSGRQPRASGSEVDTSSPLRCFPQLQVLCSLPAGSFLLDIPPLVKHPKQTNMPYFLINSVKSERHCLPHSHNFSQGDT